MAKTLKNTGTAASMAILDGGISASATNLPAQPAANGMQDGFTKTLVKDLEVGIDRLSADEFKNLRKLMSAENKRRSEARSANAPAVGSEVVIDKPKSSAHGKTGRVEYITRSRAFVRIEGKRDAMGFGFSQLATK